MRSFATLRTTLHPHDLARIHEVLRIQRALDGAHGVELYPAAVMGELVDLELADAVLGRDRAAIADHEVIDRAADRLGMRHEARFVPARRRLTVEVKIAVADMAERQRPAFGQRLLHRCPALLHEGGALAHRHPHSVLDPAPFPLLPPAR